MITKKKKITVILCAVLMLIGGATLLSTRVNAAATIEVNSTADDVDDDGECTLREAIQSANIDSASGLSPGECTAGNGADIIEFAINGPADFTNSGQDGYTIATTTTMPPITEKVIIDGYSQPGSLANTAVSPNPFNGIILIEIQGDVGQGSPFAFQSNSGESELHGISVYGFASGSAINIAAPSLKIQGNYIGTDHTGSGGVGNCVGINAAGNGNPTDTTSIDALIGGLNPEDRNIISGNSNVTCGFASGGYPYTGWVIQGNYIGLAPDGLTSVPNSELDGSGAMSVDFLTDVLIGGTDPAAKNVISGNNSNGLAPDSAEVTIQGNYIGTDYTGTVAVPNHAYGLTINDDHNTFILSNIISGNGYAGIGIINGSSEVTIQGNYIGTDESGTLDLGNGSFGIEVSDTSNNILIGGTDPSDKNIIRNNVLSAVNIGQSGSNTQNNTIIGNEIYNNGFLNLGIDLNFDGLTPNDSLDPDTGPNNLLNFPEGLEYYEDLSSTHVNFDLDVPAGDYRVEFFSNTALDSTGFGEGETFLGFQNITFTGTGTQSFSSTLTGTSLPNITATVTEIDNSSDGFGPTSEFSEAAEERPDFIDLSLAKTLTDPENVTPGGTIHYDLAVTNLGYTPADISILDGGGGNPLASVFLDFLPPELTFVSSTNPDITCTDIGTTIPGLIAANHTDWHAIACFYTGGGEILEENETFSTTFEVTVANDSDLVFTNYVVGGLVPDDPDSSPVSTIVGTAFGGGGTPDFIDEMIAQSPNNFASAVFPIPEEPETSGGSSNSGSGVLGNTGMSAFTFALVAIGLVSSSTMLHKSRKRLIRSTLK